MDTRPPLSPRQKVALECIEKHTAEHGYPPSLRELADAMGIKSTNGVLDHVIALEKKGYIERAPGVARGIRVIEQGASAELRAQLWESRAPGMTDDPTPMSPEDLANVRLFMRSWRGERDENGYLIDGPDWDTDDIVGAFARLLEDRDALAARAGKAESAFSMFVDRVRRKAAFHRGSAGAQPADGDRSFGLRQQVEREMARDLDLLADAMVRLSGAAE